jgi:hypothetical protein
MEGISGHTSTEGTIMGSERGRVGSAKQMLGGINVARMPSVEAMPQGPTSLIRMQIDPAKRISAETALCHGYFCQSQEFKQ